MRAHTLRAASFAGVVVLVAVGWAGRAASSGDEPGTPRNSRNASLAAPLGNNRRTPRSAADAECPLPRVVFHGAAGETQLRAPEGEAFLLSWHGSAGADWTDVKAGVVKRQRAMGRRFDGIAAAFVQFERRERWIHNQGALPIVAGWTPGGSPLEIASGKREGRIVAFAKIPE